jgi:hypothetical protein
MQFASFRTWRFDKMVRRQALQATTLNVSDSQVTSTSTLSHAVRLHTSTPSLAIVVHSTDPGPVVIDRDFLNLDTLSMTQPRPRTRSNNNIHVSHSILTPNHHTTVNKVIHIVPRSARHTPLSEPPTMLVHKRVHLVLQVDRTLPRTWAALEPYRSTSDMPRTYEATSRSAVWK